MLRVEAGADRVHHLRDPAAGGPAERGQPGRRGVDVLAAALQQSVRVQQDRPVRGEGQGDGLGPADAGAQRWAGVPIRSTASSMVRSRA
ncbi:hypothetical protein ADK61_00740 [Streptomyces sp. XY66]|nr:hypothetical protein ADK61_00740 [Streptomyces sp. XY66]